MSDLTADFSPPSPCYHCSAGGVEIYHGGPCPKIRAIEYHPGGTIKRVEFWSEHTQQCHCWVCRRMAEEGS